jgi:hypothetical protein
MQNNPHKSLLKAARIIISAPGLQILIIRLAELLFMPPCRRTPRNAELGFL